MAGVKNLCWTPSTEAPIRYFSGFFEQHCYLDGQRWTWPVHWYDGKVDPAWVRKHGKATPLYV